jgi:hypothetical protein
MVTTHSGIGFVTSSIILCSLAFVYSSSIAEVMPLGSLLVIVGAIGGSFPDIDRFEGKIRFINIVHRKTLHYPLGYFVLALITYVFFLYYPDWRSVCWFAIAFFIGAGLHSVMDILDGPRDSDPNEGVYEHLSRKWIRTREKVPFASLWEWIMYSFFSLGFILIAPFLQPFWKIQGVYIASGVYFITCVVGAAYESYYTLPKRREARKKYQVKKKGQI